MAREGPSQDCTPSDCSVARQLARAFIRVVCTRARAAAPRQLRSCRELLAVAVDRSASRVSMEEAGEQNPINKIVWLWQVKGNVGVRCVINRYIFDEIILDPRIIYRL